MKKNENQITENIHLPEKSARVIFVDRLAHVKPLMLDINALKVYQINMYPNLILPYEANTGTVGHCVESVQIRSFFWLVFSCIRTEYRNTRTRKNFVFGHFSRNGYALIDFQRFIIIIQHVSKVAAIIQFLNRQ